MFRCVPCNYNCKTQQNYTKHLSTRKHSVQNEEKPSLYCRKCNYISSSQYNYKKHLETQKHISTNTDISTNTNKTFYCKKCNYTCYTQQNYIKHINTRKHLYNSKSAQYKCNKCNKQYVYESGLYKHMHLGCNKSIIDENNELRNTIIELSKGIQSPQPSQTIIQNNSNNNSNNNTFNLQIFLNETCKDAVNLTEFIDNIKISLMDLETVGNKGFVKGISNIIIKNLSDMDETKRPVHCSDAKRETLYIKDNNAWEKDKDGTPKMVRAVKHISTKNIRQLGDWRDANPDFGNSASAVSDTYQSIIREVCDCDSDLEGGSEAKIIKNISKSVVIGKNGKL